MEHNFEQLRAHILELSVANRFEDARKEWSLVGIEISEEYDQCPCGQAIKEHCYIQNRLNNNRTYVGNVCINRFMEIGTGTLFEGLKRIAKDIEANPNEDLIEYAHKRGFLFGDKEYNFLMGIRGKRKFSEKQAAWKVKINRRILNQTVVKRRGAKPVA